MAALRTHAYSRSPFYRRHHAGLANAPLDELPPVTKGDLMAHWDEVVTEPALRLSEVERHLGVLTHSQGDPGVPWQGRWWAAATAGTTGRRGVFIWGRREWASVLASYARANDWAGLSAGSRSRCGWLWSPPGTQRTSLPWSAPHWPRRWCRHCAWMRRAPSNNRSGNSTTFGRACWSDTPRRCARWPPPQLSGALRISPQAVMSASEVLTRSAAQIMTAAWGAEPYDVYAATETAGIASPCAFRTRHLYEDLLVVEPVDEAGRPFRQARQARGCG